MIQPKYDSRQVFLISLGLILLVLGFYPFYITKSLNVILIKDWIFHISFILLGLFSSYQGISLWGQKDKDFKEVVKFVKEEMKANNELKKLEIEMQKLNIDKQKLAFESEKIKEKKKEHRKIDEEYKKKIDNIKDLQEKIEKKEKDLLKKETGIYEKRNKSINDLPASLPINSWTTISGANAVFSTGSSNTISGSCTTIPTMNEEKINCNFCNRIFYVNPETIFKNCPYCHHPN